jgi:hypothetical protein
MDQQVPPVLPVLMGPQVQLVLLVVMVLMGPQVQLVQLERLELPVQSVKRVPRVL